MTGNKILLDTNIEIGLFVGWLPPALITHCSPYMNLNSYNKY